MGNILIHIGHSLSLNISAFVLLLPDEPKQTIPTFPPIRATPDRGMDGPIAEASSPPTTTRTSTTEFLGHQNQKPPSLSDFLPQDVDPQKGHHYLPPFLRTMDLLHLSESSKQCARYRLHLSKAGIVLPDPCPTPAMKRGLMRLLLDQTTPLQYLRVDHALSLDLIAWGCCEGLKGLEVVHVTDEGAAAVGRALSGGSLKDLEELEVVSSWGSDRMTASGLQYITMALTQGGGGTTTTTSSRCPSHLQRLQLPGGPEQGMGHLIAKMLESGSCQHLQELELSPSHTAPGEVERIANALHANACPDLRSLKLSVCYLSSADSQALASALRSGRCARLEDLTLVGLSDGKEDEGANLDGVMDALAEGNCPNLTRLSLTGGIPLSVHGGIAFGRALSLGFGRGLRHLGLSQVFDDRLGSLPLLQAIREKNCLDLRVILMADKTMDVEHGRVLGEALGDGACPMLEELFWLDGIPGDMGVLYVTEAMEIGNCPRIRILQFGDIGVGPLAATVLGRAISGGALKHLELLDMGPNTAIGDQVLADVMRSLARACPNLRCMVFMGAGDETGAALIQGLRDQSWPKIQTISFQVDSSTDEWLTGLARALMERTYPHLNSLVLMCPMARRGLYQLNEALRQGPSPVKLLLLEPILLEEVEDEELTLLRSALMDRGGRVVIYKGGEEEASGTQAMTRAMYRQLQDMWYTIND